MPTIRILVVDDHEIVRRAICSLLRSQPDLQVIGEASDGLEAVKRAEEEHPDVVVLDIRMPELSGLEAARRIRQVAPGTEVLFLSQHDSPEVVQEALSTGARGYVVKSEVASDLIAAVRAVGQEKQFLSARVATHG